MAIRTLRDVYAAFEEGRWHTQYIYKTASVAYTAQWAPAHFQAGKPLGNPLLGDPLTFTPCILDRNNAIWFPDIPEGQERYLASVTLRHRQSGFNSYPSIVIYDLLGYYSQIDGDNDEVQEFDNTESLPRYTSGEGVQLVMINHLSPAAAHGLAIINYTNSDGIDQQVTVNVPMNGLNLVCSGVRTGAAAETGPIGIRLGPGARGVRKVNWIKFTTLPSGLFAICLIKVLATLVAGDNNVTVEREFYSKAGCYMPRIYDGAFLTWMSRIGGSTGRTVTWYGDFTFIWG